MCQLCERTNPLPFVRLRFPCVNELTTVSFRTGTIRLSGQYANVDADTPHDIYANCFADFLNAVTFTDVADASDVCSECSSNLHPQQHFGGSDLRRVLR